MDITTITWIERLGLPMAFLVALFFSIRQVCIWVGPKLEKWIERYVESQEENTKALKHLSDKSIELQEASLQLQRMNAETLKEVMRLLRAQSNNGQH